MKEVILVLGQRILMTQSVNELVQSKQITHDDLIIVKSAGDDGK